MAPLAVIYYRTPAAGEAWAKRGPEKQAQWNGHHQLREITSGEEHGADDESAGR